MRIKKILFLTLTFFIFSCGGGGGGSSEPPAPIFPSISLPSGLTVDGGAEITVAATISDPQGRLLSRSWTIEISGGKDFDFTSTNSSVTFKAPKNQEDQTATIKLSYTYRGEIPSGGTTAPTLSREISAQVQMKAVIPDTPTNFDGVSGMSQSSDFSWDISDGTATYRLYYSSSSSLTNSDSFVEIEGESRNASFIVRIPNNTIEYWAISAVNSAGESALSSPSVEITTVEPASEITNQPNTSNFNLTKMDEWGNELSENASEWSCVKDEVTGLIWEVKKDTNRTFGDDGLRDLDDKYAFYDSTNVINGFNDFGDKNVSGTDCFFAVDGSTDYNCNTEDFFKSLNSQPSGEHFCGKTNWRLPTPKEVIQLLDLNEASPNFPEDYFDGSNNIIGAEETYWTSDQVDEAAPSDQFVVTFNRDNGITEYASKTKELAIVSVSGVDSEQNQEVNFSVECFEWNQESNWRPYEYMITDAKEFAANKANQTGDDWRLASIKELIHFADNMPKGSNILSSSKTPSSQVYDDWALKIIENDDYSEKKGQIKIRDALYGTYHICLSKY
tara:strand:+ start:150 stop:1826 length:1677 start_codon:yes stop_codon:yes gene_type:complete